MNLPALCHKRTKKESPFRSRAKRCTIYAFFMENKRKHLELIQNVIDRMAGNLFYLKGWAITLIAALFAVAAKDTNSSYIIIAFFPVLLFWLLDGFFLSQERLFRALYDDVRMLDEKDIDFSMDTRKYRDNERNSWPSAMFASTLLIFYFGLIAVMLFVIALIHH